MTWQNMPVRLKQKVVDLLDYESRCNLRISSKDDWEVVDSTKFVPEKLKISEIPSDMSEGKSTIRLEIDSFTIWLTGKEDLTKIDRGWNGEISEEFSEIRQENRYEIFQKLLLKFSSRGVIEADTVELNGITCMPPKDLNFKCSSLKMYAILDDYSADWLRKLAPKFEKFKKVAIDCWRDDTEIKTIQSVLETSKSLKLEYDSGITDEQLLKIEAMDLHLLSLNITVDGAKKRVKHFLTHGKMTDILDITFSIPEYFQPIAILPKKTSKLKNSPDTKTEVIITESFLDDLIEIGSHGISN
ncbi:hypothetical protein B9Z55_004736 [Caenorhabditis nigoni]|uniref:F-box domain-containing protein n=1 Tax=Caenorhabditis nigoni TaxID=1611254 RepID=A0A2G5UXV7_9PELO|nr:hypothetical protein B9Z55_004736 [Caenorhabditis nigoni]